jgi:ankyrin repeat protein
LGARVAAAVVCAALVCGCSHDPRTTLEKRGLAFNGETFVAKAAAGDAESVRLYLDAGLPPDSANANGLTALSAAASNGQVEIARMLIDKGADLKAEKPVPELPLMRAIRGGHTDVAVLLLDRGAHAYVQDDQWTPLMLASFLGDERTVKSVIAHKPDVNARNDRGLTALMFAASGGHAAVARQLIDDGAAIDAEDIGGHTALMFAANNGRKDVVELLLAGHADVRHANRAGATAASLAAGNGEAEIVALLSGARPAAPASAAASTPVDQQTYTDAATIAWRYVERNYQPSTGLIDATAGYPFTTVWDIGSDIGALYAGHELKLIDDAEYDRRIRRLLGTIASVKLYDDAAFNKVYSTRSGAMIARGDKPSTRGYGWSAIDIGRLLVWLKVLAVNQPAYAADAGNVVKRLAMNRLVAGGYLRGEDLDHAGAPRQYQEGRLGYEQYAAHGFAAWGAHPDKALRLDENSMPVTIMGQPLLADVRGGDRLTSDPLILMGLEMGWGPQMKSLAAAFLAAQEARYRQTGRVTMTAEDAIGRPPYFFYYYCALTNGKAFALDVQDPHGVVEQPRWLSTKAAFAWDALSPSAYTALAVRAAAPARTAVGWGSGVYEGSGASISSTSTGSLNVNTAAVILAAALVHMRGAPIAKLDAPK